MLFLCRHSLDSHGATRRPLHPTGEGERSKVGGRPQPGLMPEDSADACPNCRDVSLQRVIATANGLQCPRCQLKVTGADAGWTDGDCLLRVREAVSRHANHGGDLLFHNAGPMVPAVNSLRNDIVAPVHGVLPVVAVLDDCLLWVSCSGCGETDLVV